MLVEKIVHVGIGQCGGNFVTELESLGEHNPFYVNTSLEDLDTLNTDRDNKYHIKGTKGMAKDRNLAMEVILSDNNAENVAYAVHDRYGMSHIVMVYYSLSGGTGGTMGNIVAETIGDLFPDKTVNVVAILPKYTEDVGLLANAIKSLEHLRKLQKDEVINQVYLLDNNSRDDIFSINKDFAVCFDRFVKFNEITKTGNLDEEEREKLLMEQGMAVILEFSDDDFANGIAKASDNTIHAEWLKDSKLHGVILNKKHDKEINKELIKDVLGMPLFTHQSVWSDESNILLSVGMSFNDNILIKMKKSASEQLEKKKRIEEESRQEAIEDVDFDASSIIMNTNKKRSATSTNTGSNTRRRGERKASSVLDKYRNM